jgi:hypothetical protein
MPEANLQTVIDTATLAAKARQSEFDLYNQARAKGDLTGLTTHYKGYQAALGVEQKASEVLVQQIVDSPTLQVDLTMLAEANSRLAATTDQLAVATKALAKFAEAASAVMTVLGML